MRTEEGVREGGLSQTRVCACDHPMLFKSYELSSLQSWQKEQAFLSD